MLEARLALLPDDHPARRIRLTIGHAVESWLSEVERIRNRQVYSAPIPSLEDASSLADVLKAKSCKHTLFRML